MAAKPLDVAVVRGVLDLLAQGLVPSEVARVTGVSRAAVYRLRARLGGVYRPPDTTFAGVSDPLCRGVTSALGCTGTRWTLRWWAGLDAMLRSLVWSTRRWPRR